MNPLPAAGVGAPVGVVRFAADPIEPIVLQFIDATLEVLVTRIGLVGAGGPIAPETWAVAGVYVLVGLPSKPDASGEHAGPVVRARPGRSGDVLQRVRQHAADPDLSWARRAVLVRDTRQGFNTAQAGYLEGRLHELCAAAPGVEQVGRADSDFTLQEWERDELDRRYLPHVRAVLELAGVPTEPAPGLLSLPSEELAP
jgi:hypothetical protein